MTCLSYRNKTAQKRFSTCSWSQTPCHSFRWKAMDFLYFAATEHSMCWRPLYGSGLMWDFWLMFNSHPVSNCRAMTHREPAGYRTNTHKCTQNFDLYQLTTAMLQHDKYLCESHTHTHSIQTSGHPVCPDTSRLFLNCNLSVSSTAWYDSARHGSL